MTPLFTCIYSLPDVKIFALQIYNYIIIENIKIVYFHGEIGSGKTTFIKAILNNIDQNLSVKSPTYSYMNEYRLVDKFIWHFDLYRIDKKEDITDLGLIDYLTRDDGIMFIEWPNILENFQLDKYKKVVLQFLHIENPKERACVFYTPN